MTQLTTSQLAAASTPQGEPPMPEEAPPKRVAYDPNIRGNPGDVEIPNRIFVKGFPKDATDEEIKTYFESYGIVRDTKIVRDKSGVSKGYAFVTFDSQEIAEKVKELEFLQHKDREIVIGPAKIRKKRANFLNLAGIRRGEQMGVIPGYASPVSPTYAVTADGLWCLVSPQTFSPVVSPSSSMHNMQQPFEFPSHFVQQPGTQFLPQQVPTVAIIQQPVTSPQPQVVPQSQPLVNPSQQVPLSTQQVPISQQAIPLPQQGISSAQVNLPRTSSPSNQQSVPVQPPNVGIQGNGYAFNEINFAQAINNLALMTQKTPQEVLEIPPIQMAAGQRMDMAAGQPIESPPLQCVPMYENISLDQEYSLHDPVEKVVYLSDSNKLPLKTMMMKSDVPQQPFHTAPTYYPVYPGAQHPIM